MRRPGSRELPPPLELECLKVLWKLGEGNVRAVREALAPGREFAYTTILTMLDRLARKGAVDRRKEGRAFVYVPVASRERLREIAVRHLVDGFFEGSVEELIAYLTAPAKREPARVRLAVEEEEALDPALL